jgi:porphobilinogen deaminase
LLFQNKWDPSLNYKSFSLDKILKIGGTVNNYLKSINQFFISELKNCNISCTTENIGIESQGDQLSILVEAVRDGKIDTFCYPLDQCPIFEHHDSLCISAISKRFYTGEGVLFKSKSHHPTSLAELHKGWKIAVFSERQRVQMTALFPDSTFTLYTYNQNTDINNIFSEGIDGIVISNLDYHMIYKDNGPPLSYISIHPSELIPAPGHGVMAYICHKEDFVTRTILNKIHNREMVPIVNNERMVIEEAAKEFHHKIGVYCYEDTRNNFHIHGFFADTLSKFRFSQNIVQGLGLKLMNSLLPK